MFDFKHITGTELNTIKSIVLKASEKSPLERFYLFTTNAMEKAEIFNFSYRLFVNLSNIIDEGEIRTTLRKDINDITPTYAKLNLFLQDYSSNINYGRNKILKEINKIVNEKSVNELIDTMSVFLERGHTIPVSRLKAISLEGKSGTEYEKVVTQVEEKKKN